MAAGQVDDHFAVARVTAKAGDEPLAALEHHRPGQLLGAVDAQIVAVCLVLRFTHAGHQFQIASAMKMP